MARRNSTPGFRFRPTDVELIEFFLKRKVRGKNIPSGVIAELDLYKYAPWDLPDKSVLQSGDLEWYFFCPRGKKYLTGGRLNRATEAGYWKTTGKDREIEHKNRVVGMIKTLVFHTGKAPKGDRTDWVMHEFRLDDKDMVDEGISQDSYVICRVFQKEGPGPRNGAQYGKPYDEKDWDTDEEIDSEQSAGVVSVSAPVPIQPSESHISVANDIHTSTSGCVGLSSLSSASKLIPSCSAHPAAPNNQADSVSHVSELMPSCSTLPFAPNYEVDSVSRVLKLIPSCSIPFPPNSEVDSASCVAKLIPSCLALTSAPNTVSELIPSCLEHPSTSAPNHQVDDNILSLLDYFKEDDDTLAMNENNGIEKVDTDHANNGEGAPCLDPDVIFENLGDLGSLVGLGDGSFSCGQKNRLSTSDMLYTGGDDMLGSWEPQDFLELMDLEGPQSWQNKLGSSSEDK
ncbi:unnamed protein product [Sphenostylis stenocarpa]|uniref:NAC domain-containing protein n=1 Tax=Sphenostylis stenocarpa TaxID=92480 RepID=A0AA86TE96_9FABA|nr:unnamed protein product [Sphenostylis stenocarpa]